MTWEERWRGFANYLAVELRALQRCLNDGSIQLSERGYYLTLYDTMERRYQFAIRRVRIARLRN